MITTIHVCLVHGEQKPTREWLPNYCEVIIGTDIVGTNTPDIICGRPLYEKKEVK